MIFRGCNQVPVATMSFNVTALTSCMPVGINVSPILEAGTQTSATIVVRVSQSATITSWDSASAMLVPPSVVAPGSIPTPFMIDLASYTTSRVEFQISIPVLAFYGGLSFPITNSRFVTQEIVALPNSNGDSPAIGGVLLPGLSSDNIVVYTYNPNAGPVMQSVSSGMNVTKQFAVGNYQFASTLSLSLTLIECCERHTSRSTSSNVSD